MKKLTLNINYLTLAFGLAGGALALADSPSRVIGHGTFESPDDKHEVTGGTSIIKDQQGHLYVVLDKSFQTTHGPALHVVLGKEVDPEIFTEDNSYDVAPLQKFEGAQRYQLPDTLDIENYKSVIIRCKQYKATFGIAEL